MVGTIPRHDQIRPGPTRRDELVVHWPNRRSVLLNDRLDCPAALLRVAQNSPQDSLVCRSVDEDLQINQLGDFGDRQNQNSIQQDNLPGRNEDDLRRAPVPRKIVNRPLNLQAGYQISQVLDKQTVVECIRMIPVLLPRDHRRHLLPIEIVRIVIEQAHLAAETAFQQRVDHGRFSRSRSTGNPNHIRTRHQLPQIIAQHQVPNFRPPKATAGTATDTGTSSKPDFLSPGQALSFCEIPATARGPTCPAHLIG